MVDGGLHRRNGGAPELVVARERLRAEVDTRLTGVAFRGDSDVCVDPGALVEASVRAVGNKVPKVFSRQKFAGYRAGGDHSQGLLHHLLVGGPRLDKINVAIILRHNFTDMCIAVGIVSDRDVDFGQGYSASRREIIVDDNPLGIDRILAA